MRFQLEFLSPLVPTLPRHRPPILVSIGAMTADGTNETKSTENAPRFVKTKSGKWAIAGPVETLKAALDGDGEVDVLKKSGEWTTFKIVSLGSTFDSDGVPTCYGYDSVEETTKPASSGSGGQAAAAPNIDLTNAPQADSSEPLPEFQGSDQDMEAPF